MDSKARLLIKVRRALRIAGDTHSMDDLIGALKRGEMQAHYNDRAIIITEIVQAPRRRYVNLFIVAGDMDAVDELTPKVASWAQEAGCEFARAQVRLGFEGPLKARGWEKTQLLMEYHPNGRRFTSSTTDNHQQD